MRYPPVALVIRARPWLGRVADGAKSGAPEIAAIRYVAKVAVASRAPYVVAIRKTPSV
jgi:hypothetical protein